MQEFNHHPDMVVDTCTHTQMNLGTNQPWAPRSSLVAAERLYFSHEIKNVNVKLTNLVDLYFIFKFVLALQMYKS